LAVDAFNVEVKRVLYTAAQCFKLPWLNCWKAYILASIFAHLYLQACLFCVTFLQ